MKRKWVPVLAGVLACSFSPAGCQGTDKDNGEDEANEPKPGSGNGSGGRRVVRGKDWTVIQRCRSMIRTMMRLLNLLPGAGVEYTVPAGVDGTYDIYLEIGKASESVQ